MPELSDCEFVEWCRGPAVKKDADYLRLHELAETINMSAPLGTGLVCTLATLRLDLADRTRERDEAIARADALEEMVMRVVEDYKERGSVAVWLLDALAGRMEKP